MIVFLGPGPLLNIAVLKLTYFMLKLYIVLNYRHSKPVLRVLSSRAFTDIRTFLRTFTDIRTI